MPKSIPSTGDTNWGEVLNAHLAQVMNPATGGINTNAGNVTGLTSEDEGYTFLDTNTGQIKRFKGSGDGTNDTDWDITGGGIASSSTAPSNPTAGDTYFNTTDGKMYYWNGAAWVEVGKVYNLITRDRTDKASIGAAGDWNNYIDGGFYEGSGLANECPGSSWRYCIVQRHSNSSGDYVQQIMGDFAGTGLYVRVKYAGTWKPWRKIDTVSSSSAPTIKNPGDTYYNTTESKMYYWNGTEWVEIGGGPSDGIGDAGYVAGGSNNSSTFYNRIDGMIFGVEAMFAPSATLAQARNFLGGVNSSSKGYFAGGQPSGGGSSSVVDGIDFSTRASIGHIANITGYFDQGSVNSTTKGYFTGATISNGIKGLQFSNQSTVIVSATLSESRQNLAGANSSEKGYFAGGFNWGGVQYSTTIDGIRFSDETSINPSAVLSVGRSGLAGANSTTDAYFLNGSDNNTSYVNRGDKMDFSTETSSSFFLNSSFMMGFTAVNSKENIYLCGGLPQTSTIPWANIYRIAFNFTSAGHLGIALSIARNSLAGVQSGGIL